jgi:hypothetical protein
MHRLLIGIGVAAVTLTASMQATEAQTNFPFGSRPYCWSGDRSNGGMPSCSFYTWEQCQANLHGGGSHCYANPAYAWDRGQTQKRQKRSSY